MVVKTRRDFIRAGATLVSALACRNAFGASLPRFEGIFPIMATPFTDSGALDIDTLVREAQFLHRTGVQGMVWPQLASEWTTLTFEERMNGAESLVKTVKGLAS